ncbi:hypothetical protein Slu03_28650 [Sediminihabitans luteus]|uniref:DAK2 domain-containing protein n=1 Tax=Sediminihabitans luteus TaxID=1138585 RepID=UPI0014757CC5|nr:DAK2 domain-containing protein [Sediminihabitans luteus]GIJ00488.1 hypothetical protein Slu03_28650 [Sediminihabitans luteus]
MHAERAASDGRPSDGPSSTDGAGSLVTGSQVTGSVASGALVASAVVTNAVVTAWAACAVRRLRESRPALDALNVFPVADADTGTNLWRTFVQGQEALSLAAGAARARSGTGPAEPFDADASAQVLLARLAHGALLGARGNSGLILAAWLQGLSTAPEGPITGTVLARMLRAAATSARTAVGTPAPGTILTAADAAADAAADVVAAGVVDGGAADAAADVVDADAVDANLADVVLAAASGARDAATRSTQELEVLRAAGVRDAGALGLAVVLDALHETVAPDTARRTPTDAPTDALNDTPTDALNDPLAGHPTDPLAGHPTHTPTHTSTGSVTGVPTDVSVVAETMGGGHLLGGHSGGDDSGTREDDVASRAGSAREDAAHHGGAGGGIEVMFVVEARPGTRGAGDPLREGLAAVGDSVGVTRGDGLWQAHVHTDDVAGAVAVARDVAELVRGEVRQCCVRAVHADVPTGGAGLVVVVDSAGLADVLARAGAVVLLSTGPTPGDMSRAVVDAGTERVSVVVGPVAVGSVAIGQVEAAPIAVALADVAASTGLGVDLVAAQSQVQALVATAAWAVDGCDAAALAAVVAGVRVVTWDAAEHGTVLPAEVVTVVRGAEVVTVLHGAAVPSPVLAALADAVRHTGGELVAVPTGEPDARLELGAETTGHAA